MSRSSTSKIMGYMRLLAGNIAISGLLLIVIEGLASWVLLARDIMKAPSLAERRHTKYDPDLGWVNEPNVHIANMYGPGVYLKTNSQAFRNNHEFDTNVPNGKYRIICSGDSFTLGYGVDNDHTWCQLLTLLDPRLETLNMGQGGYGVDQAYLWYKRDATKFESQVHLLAFITDDFYRMQSDRFEGYGKPMLDIENGMLMIKNVPVPRRAYTLSWLTAKTQNLRSLSAVELLQRDSRKIGFAPDNTDRLSKKESNEKTRQVLRQIFEDLQRIDEERSSKLVLVYLPLPDEIRDNNAQEWMQWIEKESRDLGIPLVNVFSTIRSLPYEDVINMYLDGGHLNNKGNEVVARAIYEAIKNHPALSQVFSLHQSD